MGELKTKCVIKLKLSLIANEVSILPKRMRAAGHSHLANEKQRLVLIHKFRVDIVRASTQSGI